MPQCISALIYITAFMLPNEKILRDFQMEVPNIRFGSAIKLKAGGKATCFDQALAADLLYQRCAVATRQDAAARLVPEPIQPLISPLSLTENGFGQVVRHYIECSDDRALLPERQRATQQVLPCQRVVTLDSDHSPFLCCPDALSAALDDLVT